MAQIEGYGLNRPVLDVNGVAEYLDVSVRTVWRLNRDPSFPRPLPLRPRVSRWRTRDLADYLSRLHAMQRAGCCPAWSAGDELADQLDDGVASGGQQATDPGRDETDLESADSNPGAAEAIGPREQNDAEDERNGDEFGQASFSERCGATARANPGYDLPVDLARELTAAAPAERTAVAVGAGGD